MSLITASYIGLQYVYNHNNVQAHYIFDHMTPYGYVNVGVLIVQHKNNTVHATHDAHDFLPFFFQRTLKLFKRQKTNFRTADHGWRVW